MSTARAFQLCLAVFPCVVATAMASTITLPIVSGTMTIPAIVTLPYPPATMNVVTTTGSITGSTNVTVASAWFYGAPMVTNASLITFGGFGAVTHLHVAVPAPFDIISDGAMGDLIDGQLMSPLLTQVDQQTYIGYFTGQLEVQQFLSPDYFVHGGDLYVFPASGTVIVRTGLDSLGQAYIAQESFQFGATPEPSTAALCLFTLLASAVLLAGRRMGSQLVKKPVIKL